MPTQKAGRHSSSFGNILKKEIYDMCEQNIKEEYIALRAEILQLNSQAFTLVGGSLTLNFTILGFGLSKSKLIELDPFIPFIGILILVAANILIAHKIRMAHRLAFYQKYFIEPKMPGVRWGEIGFKFRTTFDEKHNKFLASVTERFVLIQTAMISVAQLINLIALFQCQPSSMRTFILIISAVLLFVQLVLLHYINDNKPVEEVFLEIAKSYNEAKSDKPSFPASSPNK